jgi:hypothetical protein
MTTIFAIFLTFVVTGAATGTLFTCSALKRGGNIMERACGFILTLIAILIDVKSLSIAHHHDIVPWSDGWSLFLMSVCICTGFVIGCLVCLMLLGRKMYPASA